MNNQKVVKKEIDKAISAFEYGVFFGVITLIKKDEIGCDDRLPTKTWEIQDFLNNNPQVSEAYNQCFIKALKQFSNQIINDIKKLIKDGYSLEKLMTNAPFKLNYPLEGEFDKKYNDLVKVLKREKQWFQGIEKQLEGLLAEEKLNIEKIGEILKKAFNCRCILEDKKRSYEQNILPIYENHWVKVKSKSSGTPRVGTESPEKNPELKEKRPELFGLDNIHKFQRRTKNRKPSYFSYEFFLDSVMLSDISFDKKQAEHFLNCVKLMENITPSSQTIGKQIKTIYSQSANNRSKALKVKAHPLVYDVLHRRQAHLLLHYQLPALRDKNQRIDMAFLESMDISQQTIRDAVIFFFNKVLAERLKLTCFQDVKTIAVQAAIKELVELSSKKGSADCQFFYDKLQRHYQVMMIEALVTFPELTNKNNRIQFIGLINGLVKATIITLDEAFQQRFYQAVLIELEDFFNEDAYDDAVKFLYLLDESLFHLMINKAPKPDGEKNALTTIIANNPIVKLLYSFRECLPTMKQALAPANMQDNHVHANRY